MPRTALVTGGVSGIGSATAVSLKDAGYAVIVSYFGNDAEAEEFHAKTAIPVFNWNVADFEAMQASIGGIVATSSPIEILVNNAGITRDSMLHKMTLDQWRSVIDVDLGGCFNACRAVISSMRERRFGRIVNISSVNALSGQFGQTNYAAAKAGIIGFTKALALEGASRGITANVIAPGYTDTRMVNRLPDETLRGIVENVPAKRLASPEEIARGVLFLVADDSSFINGATLSINGGKYMA